MKEIVRIHNIIRSTTVLGPGKRCALWFQGCLRNCKGCMSPSSRPLDAGKLIAVESIVKKILEIKDIEGVTISGGEPFLQAEALYSLVKSIKEKSNLSIIIYTGYTINELYEMNNEKINQLVKSMIDILIDGEYIDELNDGTALRGSSNQKVHFISDRYKGFEGLYSSQKRNAEVLITSKDVFFVGIPDKETLMTWLSTSTVLNDNEE